MAPDRPPLEKRLGEAFHAEARQHPLRADFAASATASLPDRSGSPSAGWLRMALPSAAAVVVIAVVAAVAVISGLNPPPFSATVAPSAPQAIATAAVRSLAAERSRPAVRIGLAPATRSGATPNAEEAEAAIAKMR